jgi:hypothetical protein
MVAKRSVKRPAGARRRSVAKLGVFKRENVRLVLAVGAVLIVMGCLFWWRIIY